MAQTVAYRIEAAAGRHDRILGELASLGTLGVVEAGAALLAYFTRPLPSSALEVLAACGARVGAAEPVAPRDWSRSWREGLGPRRIAGLWVRPTWCASRGEPELELDPGQAFGSGEHASTRLALELLLESLRPGDCVLDLGTGSGILALGALRLGAARALALDLDPVACAAAAANARANGLSLQLVRGTLAALGSRARFDLAVANLLWQRLDPELPQLAARAGRALIVSGYLRDDAERVRARAGECGWRLEVERIEAQSGDEWCAARLAPAPPHPRARQSSRSSRRVVSSR